MGQLSIREALLDAAHDLRGNLERDIAEAGEDRMEQPGSFGEWTFKDLIAHLTSWRLVTAAQLEAGLHSTEPEFPWPSHLDEDNDTDEINRWFFEMNRDKPLAAVLHESRETFDRIEHAIAALPEDDLLTPGRFAWVHWTESALGPAVVQDMQNHYHREHEPAIRAWLAQK